LNELLFVREKGIPDSYTDEAVESDRVLEAAIRIMMSPSLSIRDRFAPPILEKTDHSADIAKHD
jgi:hypothetical protein